MKKINSDKKKLELARKTIRILGVTRELPLVMGGLRASNCCSDNIAVCDPTEGCPE